MKRLPLIRRDALSTVSHASINIGFEQKEFTAALFRAARSLGLVKRQ